jgi:hypothetical protein
MAHHALSIWEMRQRFLREFPNDTLPSDDVLKILYSPEKLEQIERVERFQREHPGEPVPSDDVLKRLYATSTRPMPNANAAPTTTTLGSTRLTTTTTTTIPPPPQRKELMVRQDSGLTFATEREWEQWKSTKQGFSDFGMDEFGTLIHGNRKMVGIAEGNGTERNEEDDDNDVDVDVDGMDNSNNILHQSMGKIPGTNVTRRTCNPSLDILKIGSHDDATRSRKSSSLSVGSYSDKISVQSDPTKSLSESVHSRKNGDYPEFRKPAFQEPKSSTNFDPFQEEDDDDEEEVEDLIDQYDEDTPSKPSSLIDLLEIPSDHLPGQKPTPDTTLQLVDHIAENFGFDTNVFSAAGNMSFSSMDSSGKPRKSKKSTNGKKDKDGIKGSKKKDTPERGTRKSRTNESGETSQRGPRALNRNISRVQSDSLGKVSQQGKKGRGKTIGRSKSASAAVNGFDFETPPSFGFGGPNAFHQPVADTTIIFKDVDDTNNKKKATGNDSSETSFFHVEELAWGGNEQGLTTNPNNTLVPSKKEKRPSKLVTDSEERDYFPSATPLASASRTTGGGSANRRTSTNATNNRFKAGWMQDMPGFVAPIQQQQQQKQEESEDDDSGFELALPSGGGDISPLTAYTRKPVRPMIRGRR